MKRYIYILGFLILLFSCDRRSVEDNQHIIHLTPVYDTDREIDDALKNIYLKGEIIIKKLIGKTLLELLAMPFIAFPITWIYKNKIVETHRYISVRLFLFHPHRLFAPAAPKLAPVFGGYSIAQ